MFFPTEITDADYCYDCVTGVWCCVSQRRSAAINTFLLNGLGTNRDVVAERLHRNCTGPNYWPDDRVLVLARMCSLARLG